MAFVFAAFTGLLHQAFFGLISAQIGGNLWATLHLALHRSSRANTVGAEVSGFVRVSEPASLRSLCFVSLWVSCVDAFAYMEKRCHHLLPLPSSRSLCSAGSWAFPAERSLPRPAKRGGAGGVHPPICTFAISFPRRAWGVVRALGRFSLFFFSPGI